MTLPRRSREWGSRPWARWSIPVLVAVLLVAAISGVVPPVVGASPARPLENTAARAQSIPDWMTPDTAARLDLGFTVLVPSYLPSPFGAEPSVYATGGYYSLYWVQYGGPPTFLEVTGEVGGTIPDGSAYDLNNQLVVNADVQGYPAYHDLTPIYDTVWWQMGDTVYKVSLQNVGSDSVSLANALTALAGGGGGSGDTGGGDTGGGDTGGGDASGGDDADGGGSAVPAPIISVPEVVASGEVATLAVEGVSGAVLQADDGTFLDTGTATYDGVGGFSFDWRAPTVDSDETLSFVLIDPDSGDWLATASTQVQVTVEAASAGGSDESDDDGDSPLLSPDDESEDGASERSASPQPPDTRTVTSNLTGSLAMTCPVVGYSGRLLPIKLDGASPAVVDATLGGWPNEPGNRSYDGAVDGGPTLVGSVSDSEQVFLHWRAPTVTDTTIATFYVTHPDGTALAECEVSVRPGDPPAPRPRATPSKDEPPLEHDGSGGPEPFTSGSSGGVGGGVAPESPTKTSGDASGGPVAPTGDGTGGNSVEIRSTPEN